jgi:outer membrane immunogenic protein
MRLALVIVALGLMSVAAQPAAAQFAGPNVSGNLDGVFGALSQQTVVIPSSSPPPCVECGDGSSNLRGLMGGLGLGYNWQAGHWVYGLAADFSLGDSKGSASDCGIPLHECGGALRSLGTARAVVGWSFGTWMSFATGGYAYGDVHAYDAFYGGSGNKYRSGWTIGGGIEAILSGPWSAKLEYLYVDLGNDHIYDLIPGVPEHVNTTASVIRLGLNYRFAALPPSAPIVRKPPLK